MNRYILPFFLLLNLMPLLSNTTFLYPPLSSRDFSTSDISPHDKFFSTCITGDTGDKYEVWLWCCRCWQEIFKFYIEFIKTFQTLTEIPPRCSWIDSQRKSLWTARPILPPATNPAATILKHRQQLFKILQYCYNIETQKIVPQNI